MEKENKQCNEKDLFLEKLFQEYLPEKDNLIQMLNEIQEHYGYVPMHVQKELSEYLGIPIMNFPSNMPDIN